MADGENGALEAQQIVLQPLRGVEIEMVRGLVKQKNVGIFENQAGQVYPCLFPAGEGGEFLGEHGGGDVQAVCDPGPVHLHLIAPQKPEVLLQAVIFPEKGGRLVMLHALGELLHALGDCVEAAVGVLKNHLGGPALGIDRNLGDQAHALSRRNGDLPLVRPELARQDAKERGLAAAIVAEDAHALPLGHGEGETVEHISADLKGFDDIADG